MSRAGRFAEVLMVKSTRNQPREPDFFCYLPVNETAIGWGTYLTSVGRCSIPAGMAYPPKGHPAVYDFDWKRGRVLPEFSVMLITSGAGQFESSEVEHIQFEAPALLFLFAGVWHRYRPRLDTGWTERWISFNGEIAHRLFEMNLIYPKNAVSPVTRADELKREFDRLLHRVHQNPSRNSVLYTVNGLRVITTALGHALENAAEDGGYGTSSPQVNVDPIIARALHIIWNHSHHTLTVDDVARQLPVTRRTLDRRFAESLGHSVLEEIYNCRLTRARRLLAETDLPLKNVAYLAGFSSPDRLRVSFLSKLQMTPSEYREMHSHRRG